MAPRQKQPPELSQEDLDLVQQFFDRTVLKCVGEDGSFVAYRDGSDEIDTAAMDREFAETILDMSNTVAARWCADDSHFLGGMHLVFQFMEAEGRDLREGKPRDRSMGVLRGFFLAAFHAGMLCQQLRLTRAEHLSQKATKAGKDLAKARKRPRPKRQKYSAEEVLAEVDAECRRIGVGAEGSHTTRSQAIENVSDRLGVSTRTIRDKLRTAK